MHCYSHQRILHSFPTRRSSDLSRIRGSSRRMSKTSRARLRIRSNAWPSKLSSPCSTPLLSIVRSIVSNVFNSERRSRSEEHTSELQSHSDLVCRLLLEKKKYKC